MRDNKYLEEIEEILRRTEAKETTPRRRWVSRMLPPFSRMRLPHLKAGTLFSPGWLMAAGVAALVLAMILRPFFRWLTVPFLWVGLGLFILAYMLFLIYPRRPRYEKRWRGHLVEDEPPSLWQRIRRSLRRF